MITEREERLWQLIDYIDTGLDMYKPEKTPFVEFIIRQVAVRHKILRSDGYKLYEL